MIRVLWPLLIGLGIWSVGFVLLYALQALGCVWSWPEGPHRLVLVAAWLATLGVLGGTLLFQRRSARPDRAIERAGIIATIVAIAATVVTFAPATFASLCL